MHCKTIAWAPPGTSPLADAMWRDRKQLFVDTLRWDVNVIGGCYEIDRFDGPYARYIVALDAADTHAGSLRLLPTTEPHILGDLFAALCDGTVPCGAGVFEITRLCLPVQYPAAERLRVRNRLISAMVDHALVSGISTLTGVVSARFREEVLAMGWRARALGPVQRIDGTTLGAFAITIDADTAALLADKSIYSADTLATGSLKRETLA